MMKYSVYVTFQIEGFHNFPEAKDLFPEVGFLADKHRHMFHFKCTANVSHTDRDIEFILFKRQIQKQLRVTFTTEHNNVLDFGRMSCEDIAVWLLEQFPELIKVEVSEDGENGSIVER